MKSCLREKRKKRKSLVCQEEKNPFRENEAGVGAKDKPKANSLYNDGCAVCLGMYVNNK